ncbi:hypothetical protein SCYAM73S_06325 [Streptomyces cyaneofuscatus]
MVSTFETCSRVAEVRLRPEYAPAPFAAHQRRFSAGAETTPTTGWNPFSPASISEISVAHTGTPRT